MAAGPGSPGPSTRCSGNAAASSWGPATTGTSTWSSPAPTGNRCGRDVLNHLRRLTADAGLPAIRVHDLRHVAATIMINQGVPLAGVECRLDGGEPEDLGECTESTPTMSVNAQPYDHCSTLRTSEDMLGLPPLGCAATAVPMTTGFRL
jgi:hypothetical protein